MNIRNSIAANDSTDRLVVTGTDSADRYLLTADGTTGSAIGTIQALEIKVGQTALSPAMVITHQGVENVEIDTRGGDDHVAVKTNPHDDHDNTGAGNDSVYLGSNATLGGLNQADTNVNGNPELDQPALLTVNGQGTGDQDVLNLDDTGDAAPNQGHPDRHAHHQRRGRQPDPAHGRERQHHLLGPGDPQYPPRQRGEWQRLHRPEHARQRLGDEHFERQRPGRLQYRDHRGRPDAVHRRRQRHGARRAARPARSASSPARSTTSTPT